MAELDKWDTRFLELAKLISYWSKDIKTKVGCVITNDQHQVLSLGFNGLPRGVKDTEDRLCDKPTKLLLTIHAELNAVLNATSSLKGATVYVTHRPCCRCAVSLVQSGVKRIVYLDPDSEDWSGDDQEIMREIVREAGVKLLEAKIR